MCWPFKDTSLRIFNIKVCVHPNPGDQVILSMARLYNKWCDIKKNKLQKKNVITNRKKFDRSLRRYLLVEAVERLAYGNIQEEESCQIKEWIMSYDDRIMWRAAVAKPALLADHYELINDYSNVLIISSQFITFFFPLLYGMKPLDITMKSL